MAFKKLKKDPAITILVIDDHQMVRDGLKMMLRSLKKFMNFNVLEADSGEDAIKKINRNKIDLIIIDYQMPGLSGPDTVYSVLRFKPGIKILALSNYHELSQIQSMMDAGAKGYVLKNIEPAEMLNAIKTILAGKNYYCNDVAIKLIDSEETKHSEKVRIQQILTVREAEVLQMIAMEMTNEEIAEKLCVAKRTVDTHRQNLINKLRVKNTAGLVKAAFRLKLIEMV